MKKLITLLLAVLMLVSLVACGTSEPAPTEPAKAEAPAANAGNEPAKNAGNEPAKNEKPFAGVTLNILTANFSATRWMYEHLPEFEEKTGIKVVVEELGLEQINTKTMVVMTAGGADVDLICFQPDKFVKMYTANGWLEPLDRYLTDEEYDIEDINKATYALSNINGHEYYMPMYGCEHTIVYYNKEMIQAAGIDPDAIKTYDDLVVAARTVEDKIPGVAGITLRGQGYNAITVIADTVHAYGGDYLDENGNAAVNSPEFIEGMMKYRELLDYAPNGWAAQTNSDTVNIFAQKLAAFRIDTIGSYSKIINADSSLLTHGDVGFLTMPAGSVRAACASANWGIAISYGSKNKDAAWEFIKWQTGKESALNQTLNNGVLPARISVMNNEEVMAAYPAEYWDCLLKSGPLGYGTTLPDIKYSGEARTMLGAAIDEAYAGGDVKAIMDKANADLQDLIDQERLEG